jgi:hypothetical protein
MSINNENEATRRLGTHIMKMLRYAVGIHTKKVSIWGMFG